MEEKLDMDRATALAYLSAATDFNVSQVVDGNKGIHALIRKKDFASILESDWAVLMSNTYEQFEYVLKDLFFRYENARAKTDLVRLKGFFQLWEGLR